MPRRPRLLTATLVALALLAAACGGSSSSTGGGSEGTTQAALPPCPLDALANSPGPVEVVIWHFFGQKVEQSLKDIAAAYNASQTKVKVRVENQGTSSDELFKKYQAAIKTKDLPAIAVLDDTVLVPMADSGTVLPAQSCIDADNYDMSDFLATGKAYYTINGTLYPASLNLSGALLYYNKNHYRRVGLDPNTTPQTLDEVRQYAQKIKDARATDPSLPDQPVALKLNPPLMEMWLTGAGQAIVNNDNGRGTGTTDQAAFDTSTTVGLYTWAQQMQADGLLQVVPDTPGQVGQYLAMANQQASMTIETSTAATSVKAFLGGNLPVEGAAPVDLTTLDFGAAKVPGIKQAGRLQMGGGAWYMTKTVAPDVQAGAWDFMKFFNSLESQVKWNLDGSYLPYRVSAAKDARIIDAWQNDIAGRWLAIAYDELLNGVDPNFPGPLIGPYDQFRTAMRTSIEDMLYKQVPPATAVTNAANQTTTALAQYAQGNF